MPLTEVTKKNVPFKWGEGQKKEFKLIKENLINVSLLVLPNLTKTCTRRRADNGSAAKKKKIILKKKKIYFTIIIELLCS